jgi:hypothetical protein
MQVQVWYTIFIPMLYPIVSRYLRLHVLVAEINEMYSNFHKLHLAEGSYSLLRPVVADNTKLPHLHNMQVLPTLRSFLQAQYQCLTVQTCGTWKGGVTRSRRLAKGELRIGDLDEGFSDNEERCWRCWVLL